MQRAERVEFVSGENGWEMHVTTEDGFARRYNIHGIAWNLVTHLSETLGDWYRGGLAAATDLHKADGAEVDFDLARAMAREQRLELDD